LIQSINQSINQSHYSGYGKLVRRSFRKLFNCTSLEPAPKRQSYRLPLTNAPAR
jgi:hypothetical protein